MASRSSQPLVLEYKKRRFDGGSEKELIAQIELQYQLLERQQLAAEWHPASQMAPASLPGKRPGAPMKRSPSRRTREISPRRRRLYQALVVPYVELVLGLSGVLIGYLMVFSIMKHAVVSQALLKEERNALIRQSWGVVWQSLAGILCAPWHMLRPGQATSAATM